VPDTGDEIAEEIDQLPSHTDPPPNATVRIPFSPLLMIDPFLTGLDDLGGGGLKAAPKLSGTDRRSLFAGRTNQSPNPYPPIAPPSLSPPVPPGDRSTTERVARLPPFTVLAFFQNLF
jgi:hypothetical protein